MSTDKTNQSWGGRFSEPVDAFVARFTASVTFDQRLYRHDIMGSVAHATMLAKVGVLTDAERDSIIDGLKTIQSEIEAGTFDWRIDLEDVHMNIEARLTDRIGVTGKKLHTGRSRNDQVATDIRLWLRDEIDLILAEITRLQKGLLEQAEREAETIMPGFTHLQTAQPVTFGHHMLAWFEMLSRDYERLVDCRKRTNRMPLGSAALAGTTYPIDREFTAQLLGFDAVGGNSLDNVSDRDFAIEFCAAASIDLKKDEPGLAEFCKVHGWPITFYPADELRVVPGQFTPSAFVASVTGVDNVCERSAVKASGGMLLLPKTAGGGVTLALAVRPFAPDWRTEQ